MKNFNIYSPAKVPVTYCKSELPPAKAGNCVIEKFEVAPLPKDVVLDPSIPDWARRRPGQYTVLIIDGVRMMTDLFEEWWSQRMAIQKALQLGGHVLISGLGLGLIIDAILSPHWSAVKKVTVIEKNPWVIQLVADHFMNKYRERLEIIHEDALKFIPPQGQFYSVVWHDIWPNPATIPTSEIKSLQSKYQDICQWQGFWTLNAYAE